VGLSGKIWASQFQLILQGVVFYALPLSIAPTFQLFSALQVANPNKCEGPFARAIPTRSAAGSEVLPQSGIVLFCKRPEQSWADTRARKCDSRYIYPVRYLAACAGGYAIKTRADDRHR